MKFLMVLVLSSLSFARVEAAPADVSTFGGEGAKIYYGTNSKAWFKRYCKVVIMGTSRTPVTYISISDSANTYSFWTYSQTISMGEGFDADSANVSDNMYGDVGFSNVGHGASGLADLVLRRKPGGNELARADFAHYDADGKKTEISCGRLTR